MTQTELTPTASLTGKWKPYPAYKDSGVEWLGEIPAHWEIRKLKRLCSYITDGSHFSPVAQLDGKSYVTVRDLVEDTVDVEHAAKISEEDFAFLEKNGCKPRLGDVLLTKDGTIGRATVVTRDDFVVLSSLAILRPNNLMGSRFLRYFLVSGIGVDQMFSWIAGAALRRLTLSVIVDLLGTLPPLPEQYAIAAFLDREITRINALIAKKERLIELLQEKRAALISHAVTKGLDPTVPMKDSGVEWLGEIPAHWEMKRMKYVAQNGFVNGLFKKKDQFGSGTKLVNVVDLYRDNFLIDFESLDRVETEQEEYETFKVLSGDIFFVRSSLKLEGVGSSASIIEVPEPTVFECHVVRMRPSSKLIVSKYLINYLNSSLVRQRLVALAETTTMTTIAQPKLASLEVIVPPISEQDAIATYLDRETAKIDALISRIREGIEKLKEYSTALISAAVTGKIDVRDEIASQDG